MNDMYGSSYGKELYKAAETRPSAQVNDPSLSPIPSPILSPTN